MNEPLCKCGDRPAAECDEEWGPECSLGNSMEHARAATDDVAAAVNAGLASPACLWGWVDASERLPDVDGMPVVVFDPDNHTPLWPAVWSAENGSFHAGGGWFESDEVTHWIPMPPLPGPRKDREPTE